MADAAFDAKQKLDVARATLWKFVEQNYGDLLPGLTLSKLEEFSALVKAVTLAEGEFESVARVTPGAM